MIRIPLFALGISACIAAWAVYTEERKRRRVPVTRAAAMLQKAWSDHHTVA